MGRGKAGHSGARVRASRARSRVSARRKTAAPRREEPLYPVRRAIDLFRRTASRKGEGGEGAGTTIWSKAGGTRAPRTGAGKVAEGGAGNARARDATGRGGGRWRDPAGGAKEKTPRDRRCEEKQGSVRQPSRRDAAGRRPRLTGGGGSRGVRMKMKACGGATGETAAESRSGTAAGARGIRGARPSVLFAVLALATGVLLWVYFSTGVLNVREVEVRGNERLDASRLRALSGITPDTHLLKMDVKAVEKALLSDPYVAGVEVSRRIPATVVLEIEERKPVGFVRQNGRSVLLAGDGTVLESMDQEAPSGLAEIRAQGLPLLVPGSRLESEDFRMVASLLSSMDERLEAMVDAAGRAEGKLYFEACGTKVLYGDLSEIERKNSIAFLALSDLLGRYRALEYIDVSFPDRPVIKPREGGEAASAGSQRASSGP